MFTFFTDRDGKYQLAALAESGFDPLSRTCRFMLTEEAHHMFVGETGVTRVVQRTGEVMRELGTDDPERLRAAGVIDLPTVQKYINFHYSVSVDLFGQEISTNAANYFTAGLKGRYLESRLDDDHRLTEGLWPVHTVREGSITVDELSALSAVNERLRDDYIKDCERGLSRWNRALEALGVDFKLDLPHRFFNRRIGNAASVHVSPDGRVISEGEWQANESRWLPTNEDMAYVDSLMRRVIDPGKIAGWIAPPVRGIDGKPWDFEYVRFG
jgi:benzoyl-CoA 2,3-dioxygenase component B